jgi:hypothetical protein
MNPEGYYYQAGWPGAVGFPLPGAARGCGCGSFPPPFPINRDCDRGPFPLIDSANVIYHLFPNSGLSNLTNMGLPNGTPAQLIFDTLDGFMGPLLVANWYIPNTRAAFPTVNFKNVQQFGQAVDWEIGTINANIATISGSSLVPITATNTPTLSWNLTGTLNHNLSANVNLSAASGNTLTINDDGLFNAPQQLTINYLTNQIGISGGNTVQLPNAPAGYLGNLSSDPGTAVDGNTWYNTSSSQYKVKVNGSVHVITIT